MVQTFLQDIYLFQEEQHCCLSQIDGWRYFIFVLFLLSSLVALCNKPFGVQSFIEFSCYFDTLLIGNKRLLIVNAIGNYEYSYCCFGFYSYF